jgi:hypothetical protein
MLKDECDIAVVGSGAAGIAAAVNAARTGCRVLLIEQDRVPGGIVVRGGITTLCGLYRDDGHGCPEPAYEGFPAEFAGSLMGRDGVDGPLRTGKVHVLPFRPATFLGLASRLLATQKDLRTLFSTRLSRVEVQDDFIRSLEVRQGREILRIQVKAVVDCTGDAVVADLAGTPMMEGNDARQAPAVIFHLWPVPGGYSVTRSVQTLLLIKRAANAGLLPQGAAAVRFMPSLEQDTLTVKLNLGPAMIEKPPIPPAGLAKEAGHLVRSVVRFLKSHVTGFAACPIPRHRPFVLRRTGRRIKGHYILSGDDVLAARTFSDAATMGCWPMEKWEAPDNFILRHLGRGYDIPERALRSAHLNNLFAAGKSISADEDAISSARVIGSCLATGEAAGRLAAGYAQRV